MTASVRAVLSHTGYGTPRPEALSGLHSNIAHLVIAGNDDSLEPHLTSAGRVGTRHARVMIAFRSSPTSSPPRTLASADTGTTTWPDPAPIRRKVPTLRRTRALGFTDQGCWSGCSAAVLIKGRFRVAETGRRPASQFGKPPVLSGQPGLLAGSPLILTGQRLLGRAQSGRHVRELSLQMDRPGFQNFPRRRRFAGVASPGISHLPVDGTLLPVVACIGAEQCRFTAIQSGLTAVHQLPRPLDRLI